MRREVFTCRVELGARAYDILVGGGLLAQVGSRVRSLLAPSSVAVIADELVAGLFAERVKASLDAAGLSSTLITFPAGEASKRLSTLERILERMLEAGMDRKSCVIALGGGVSGDLAGFAAATFMRGIPCVQAPTSLLAMVDSSSGGKTGVNLAGGKNLVGAFHQPRLVLADVDTLASLPREELLCGLAEVVKHGMIRDAGYFALVEKNCRRLLAMEPCLLQEVIAGSCRIKAGVVAADEREQGLRAILNLGHTFGHAYEQLSGFALRHGEAVAMGMVQACRTARKLRGLDAGVEERLRGVLLDLGLPAAPPAYPPDAVRACMLKDKKTRNSRLRLVLPLAVGRAEVVELEPGTRWGD